MLVKDRGFTLIEVLITVVIIGILAGIAWPSYMGTVRKSNRAEAKTELTDLAQRLQRCYSAYGKFNDQDNCAVYKDLADADGYTTRVKGFYNVTIDNVSATSYTLTATAVKSPQTEDVNGCEILTLTHKGQKGPDDCW